MSEQETISLAEAVAIWLETGEFPKEKDGPMVGSESDLREFRSAGSSSVYVFHKDQRFVKPVKRKTASHFVENVIYEDMTQFNSAQRAVVRHLAHRIDELEKKVK